MNRLSAAVLSLCVCAVPGVYVFMGYNSYNGVPREMAILPGHVDSLSVAGMEFAWEQPAVDAHMTGVGVPGVDSFDKSIGVVEDGVYRSPNGAVFKSGSAPKVAAIMLEHQPQMATLREVIGYSENGMVKDFPEGPLTDWAADVLLKETARIVERKVDVAIINFGGIRCDFPAGNIVLDDVRSMFPFQNNICYVRLKGRDLRSILVELATRKLEAVAGCTLMAREGKLLRARVGGEPIDPDKIYGLATIDFLLDGGDGHRFGRDAVSVKNTGVLIGTVMEQYVRSMTAAGRTIDYKTDGRIDIVFEKRKK